MPGVQLFSDQKFFVLQRVPARASLIQDIERHGGRVVKLESQADHVIADHIRKDAPPGSLSYTFVEAAIRADAIPDTSRHLAGATAVSAPSSSARPYGTAFTQSAPGSRTAFTAEDDRVLWDWVKRAEAQGGLVRGNEIYKELARFNPRHPFQSWRDRYIKYVSKRAPIATAPAASRAPPTPPSELSEPLQEFRLPTTQIRKRPRPSDDEIVDDIEPVAPEQPHNGLPRGFTEVDLEDVIKEADHIEDIPFSAWDDAWQTWSEIQGRHTAKQWEQFYKTYARKEYLKRKAAAAAAKEAKPSPANDQKPRKRDTKNSPFKEAAEDTPRTKRRRVDATEGHASGSRGSPQKVQPSGSEGKAKASISKQAPSPVRAATREALSEIPWKPSRRSEHALPKPSPLGSADLGREELNQSPSVRASQRTATSSPGPMPSSPPQPASLTAANLANMRAHHQEKTASRGKDILEDDEDQDLSEYAGALHDLLPKRMLDMLSSASKPTNRSPSAASNAPAITTTKAGAGTISSLKQKAIAQSISRRSVNSLVSAGSVQGSSNADATPSVPPALLSGSRNAFALGSARFRLPRVQARSSPLPAEAVDSASDLFVALETPEPQGEFDLPEPEGDFDLPEPEGDFDLPDPEGEFDLPEPIPRSRPAATETQAIFEAETQQLDFALPGLDDFLELGDDSESFHTRRRQDFLQHDDRPASPIPSECADDVEAYIDAKLRSGFREEDVLDALDATCMQTKLAELALRSLKQGRGLPSGITGIWTRQDDEDLNGQDPGKIKRLEAKHGTRELSRRFEFLEDAR